MLMTPPTSNLPVQSYDGHPLGTVAGHSEGRILLQPRHGSPFWLDAVHVRAITADFMTLHIDRATLDRYRPDAPSHPHRTAAVRAGEAGLTLAMFAVALLAAITSIS